jgi:hypothetical protein
MHGHARLVSGVFSVALVASQPAQAVAASPAGLADDPWEIVPEETLRDLRGGIDLGSLVANFAIERSVEVDGVVVARMQIVITNLDRLGNGGMPTVSITGPLAELVQVLAANPNAASANGASATAGAAAALAAATTPASSVPAGSTRPTVAPNSSATAPATSASASPAPQSTAVVGGGAASIGSGGNGGSVSATGTQTGSTAQFGNAIATATTATGATQATTGSAPSSTTPAVATASTSSSGTAPANTNSQASSAAPPTVAVAGNSASASPTAAASANSSSTQPTRIIPVGTTGQVVVVSNLPNATAITTAVQNSVRAATIQTQTTISATLNSLQVLNALTLGNAIRQQIATGP